MHPFILIRAARLPIDSCSYGNLSDQLNLLLHSLSHLFLGSLILNALHSDYLRIGGGGWRGVEAVAGEYSGCVRFREECVIEVYNM